MPLAERQRRVDALRTALREFGETYPEELDLVVVSGDITVAGERSGYELFAEVLAELGNALPPRERILVVPGNHDVVRGHKPSTREHYGHFLEFVRDEGFTVSQLEGIDIRPSDGRAHPGATNPVAVSLDRTLVVVALNSSNYSGVLEPSSVSDAKWRRAFRALSDDDREAAKKELHRLRLRDAARVSPGQLSAARRELRRVRNELRGGGVDLARMVTVAVLHHQVLPVSETEELKAYEALSNLGQFRQFLRVNGIDVVLHGHKHVGAIYWDAIPRPDARLDEDPHRVLVISGGALGTTGYTGEAFRLVEIDRDAPLRLLSSTSYGGVAAGSELRTLDRKDAILPERTALAADGVARVPPVIGATITDVYRRALGEIERRAGTGYVANLICEIREPGSPLSLPDTYPAIPNVADSERHAWVQDLVDWWQRPDPMLGPNLGFNHGGRIHDYAGRDQLLAAEEALKNAADSSRAIVVLVDPTEDEIEDRDLKFPAFCLVQFAIRAPTDGPRRLDCTAYFRKQEIRWWWPINVAELTSLQSELCAALRPTYDDLVTGTIVTVAAIAKAGDAVPRVAVPKLDRLLEDDPTELWMLAAAAAIPSFPDRSPLLESLSAVLDDLQPADEYDPDGVPVTVDGLQRLVDALRRVATGGDGLTLRQALKGVLSQNRIYVERMGSRHAHRTWVREAGEALDDAKTALNRIKENA